MADFLDFYSEKKFCRHCDRYVRYLVSLTHSYCVACGEPVNLFSREDWRRFRRPSLPAKKSSFLAPITRKQKHSGKGED